MSKTETPPDTQNDRVDEETRESLEFVAENYDGVVGATAEMLLQPSEESNE